MVLLCDVTLLLVMTGRCLSTSQSCKQIIKSRGGVLSMALLQRVMIKIANGHVISVVRNTARRFCSEDLDYPTWKVNNTNVGYNFPMEAECPVLGAKKTFDFTFESHNHRKERANSGEGQSP